MSLAERREAVKDVVTAWSYHAGNFDAAAMGKLFTEDSEVHGLVELVGGQGPLKGPQAVVDMLAGAFVNFNWLTQMNNFVRIEFDADGKTARTRTNLVERCGVKARNTMFVLVAVYDDVLTLTADGWRFSRRTITPHDVREMPCQAL